MKYDVLPVSERGVPAQPCPASRVARLGWAAALLAALVAGGLVIGSACGSYPAVHRAPAADVAPAFDFSSLRGFCDKIPAVPEAEFAARRERLAELLRSAGQAAFIAEPGPTLDYLVGPVSWSLSERPFLLVVAANNPAVVTFIAPRFELIRASERIAPIRNSRLLTWEENESAYSLVLSTLDNASVAVDPNARSFIFDGLNKAAKVAEPEAGASVASSIVASLRAVKSQTEIGIMRCANEATKAVIETVAKGIVPGMAEKDVSAAISQGHQAAGLTPAFALVLFGDNAASPHGVGGGSRILKKGELVLIDAGAKLLGYESDVTRTFAPRGTVPTDRQKMVWKTVQQAQKAALAKIQPGVVAGELDFAARSFIEGAGFPTDAFAHRLGHGIGLQGHEEYYLVKGNAVALPVRTTFSVEPGIYLPGEIGVRIEDIAVITETGVEVLGKTVGEELELIWQ